jgi:hypothetical protein
VRVVGDLVMKVFFISFAIFQIAGHDFYALDTETQFIYLLVASHRALQRNGFD